MPYSSVKLESWHDDLYEAEMRLQTVQNVRTSSARKDKTSVN